MITRRREWTRLTGLTCLALVMTIGGLGCADKNKMYEAACRTDASYDTQSGQLLRLYTYDPTNEVYHSTFQNRFYWMETDGWESGELLPDFVAFNTGSSVLIELPTSKPFTMHEEVLGQYPNIEQLRAQAAAADEMTTSDSTASDTTGTFASVPTND